MTFRALKFPAIAALFVCLASAMYARLRSRLRSSRLLRPAQVVVATAAVALHGMPAIAEDAAPLIEALASDKEDERARAIEALQKMGDAAVEPRRKAENQVKLAPRQLVRGPNLRGDRRSQTTPLTPVDLTTVAPFGEIKEKGIEGDPNLLINRDTKLIVMNAEFVLEQGPLEYLVTQKHSLAKLHETVVGVYARPRDISFALLACAYTFAGEMNEEGKINLPKEAGILISIEYEWEPVNAKMAPPNADGTPPPAGGAKKWIRVPIEYFAMNSQTDRPMKRSPFAFTGSKFEKGENGKMEFMAELEKSIVALKYDPYALLNTLLDTRDIDPQHAAGYALNRYAIPPRRPSRWDNKPREARKMTSTPSPSRSPGRLLLLLALIISLAFAAGFAVPFCLKPLLPLSDPGFSYIAIAASFVINLACLGVALAWLPDESRAASRGRIPHFFAWAKLMLAAVFSYAGLWAAPVHRESIGVFAALAFLTATQTAALLAVHALLTSFFGPLNRLPKTFCAFLLTALACALFWTGEPIQRLARSGGNGALYASYFADGVVKLSPPAAVAATWYEDSDGARAPELPSSRRFDLVHSPLTYGVWIGSYQAVASPEILPSGGGGDFYSQREFVPGVALTLLVWALPLMGLCEVLMYVGQKSKTMNDE